MRHLTRAVALAFCLGLAGCYTPQLPASEPFDDEPRSTWAEIKAHGDQEGEVKLKDLCAAHGLTVQIDKVTGKRVLVNESNKVVILTGSRTVTINGMDYPLLGEVRWRDGEIVLPGDARVVFGDRLRRRPIPEIGKEQDFAYLDQAETQKAQLGPVGRLLRPSAPVRPSRNTTFTIDPNAPPLPASWNQPAKRQWQYIVIHHSATNDGGAESFNRAHARKWENGLGYHFVVGNGTETRDGQIEIGSRWLRQNQGIDGAHAGVEKYNKHGIGICLVGDFDHHNPSPKQLAALRNLVRHLMERYHIPKDHILPHRSVKAGHTECPGKAFPFEQILRSL